MFVAGLLRRHTLHACLLNGSPAFPAAHRPTARPTCCIAPSTNRTLEGCSRQVGATCGGRRAALRRAPAAHLRGCGRLRAIAPLPQPCPSVCGSAAASWLWERPKLPMAAVCALRPPLHLGRGLQRPGRAGGRQPGRQVSRASGRGQQGRGQGSGAAWDRFGGSQIAQGSVRAAAAGSAGGRGAAPGRRRRPADVCRPGTLPRL